MFNEKLECKFKAGRITECLDRKIRNLKEDCKETNGTQMYTLHGRLGKVNMALCPLHFHHVRKYWRRVSVTLAKTGD